MTEIQIIKLLPEEWQQYRQIRLDALLEEPQAFGSRYDDMAQRPASFWQGRLSDAQAEEKSWLLFAKENDQLIGMIGAHTDEDASDVVEIISVYVAGKKRGLGAGNLLMAAIMDEVMKYGVFRKAVLEVNVEQTAAVALYQRFGFVVVGKNSGIQGDGIIHTGYIMERMLAPIP